MSDEMNALVPFDEEGPAAEPVQPGYYRVVRKTKDHAKGDIVYVLGMDRDQVEVASGDHRWWWGRPDFEKTFEFDPEGLTHRTEQVTQLMREAAALQAEGSAAERLLREFNPHVDEAGDLSSTALVTTSTSAMGSKQSVALLRNAAAKLRRDLQAKQSAIKAYAEEQALILRRQADELQALVRTAEEAVWTINLYLGQNEEVVRLAEGAPAPASTPIVIRQLVLYMDEECAVAADEGGIDASGIERFDDWLVEDPAHLRQVLPDPKGMVAIKPRRKSRDYKEPIVNTVMGAANRKTYFLLRNGDNLYRMWTDYEVGSNLVPRTNEFLRLFEVRERDWDTGITTTRQMTPGSDEFMKAEKAADSTRKHYMRAGLILQGLIDRSTIFRPLAWEQVSVGSQDSYAEGGPLKVVLDADAMLTDGRERFKQWFARVNSALDIGVRVIGTFASWEHGLPSLEARDDRGWRHRNPRISPNGADYPSSDQLHTIEDRKGEGYRFYYDREGQRWDPYNGYVDYQRRASCLVMPEDEFILVFDGATVEEMEFYLTSRLDRTEYTYLFPVLKQAIALKRAEAVEEAPFAELLAGQIARRHGVDLDDAKQAVPGLVRWYKFKNRTHRALAKDDALALRVIVKEYGLRQKAASGRTSDELSRVADLILEAEPNALLVAHKKGREYVALVPANDENIFVHEQLWSPTGLTGTRKWRVVDKRFMRWAVLYTSSSWDGWRVGASRTEHLTDPEREQLKGEALGKLTAPRRKPGGHVPVPLAISWLDEQLEIWFDDGDDAFYNRSEPALGRVAPTWKRIGGRYIEVEYLHSDHQGYRGGGFSNEHIEWPWDRADYYGKSRRLVWTDPAAIKAFRQRAQEHAAKVKADRAHADKVWRLFSGYQDAYIAEWEQKAREQFAADFGDPELWESHRKTLKLPQNLDADSLRTAIDLLVRHGEWVNGRTAGEVVGAAARWAKDELKELDPAIVGLRPKGE